MQTQPIAITDDVPGVTNTNLKSAVRDTNTTMDYTKVEPRIPSNISRDEKSHSNDNLEKRKLTDLDKCSINDENDYEYEHDRRSSMTGDGRCELHKKEDLYGNELITRRVVYGHASRATDLKFKCARDGREWMDPIRRTMVRVRAIAVVGLFLAVLATCAAAPGKSRPTRSHHHEKSAVSFY
ncbi:Uncharacterized protein OBRU01_08504 [Operophtera brumata]|uniref:Uncharacterized protein n=1 Tax=Operophtera brumata TaxID=104452 RepID=A0A0L7L3X0_OPEBR|nr:Uncharacterized protein OBRU01_08504 [Operophtera brumata]